MSDVNGLLRSELSPAVADEFVAYLGKQVPKVAIGVTLTCSVIAYFARSAPSWMLFGWLALVATMAVIRIYLLRALPTMRELPIAWKLNLVTAIALVTGVTHGLSIFFWPYLTDLQRAMQTLIVTSMCAVSIVSGLGYLRAFVAYMVPMFAPVAVAWTSAVAGPAEDGIAAIGGDALVVIALFLVTAIFLVWQARDTFRRFLDTHESRRRLHEALEQAESANRAKTRFLASASHDLRQPMHAISLFAAAILMRPLDKATRAIAGHIDTGLRTLSSQLDALLDISKLDAGVVPVRESDFQIAPMLQRVIDDFAAAASNKSLRVMLQLGPGLCVRSDPALLERVVRNLIDNAVKYTQRGEIRISLEAADGEHRLRIADSGPGIPEHEHTRVFEEFYQLGNPERDRMQGLGLGLSIVRRLSDLLGLDMVMRSQVGSGTEFELRLTAAPAPDVRAAEGSVPTADLHGLHVLVIDDEEAVRRAVEALLGGLGCRTTLVTGTEEALRSARTTRPDIVLADLRLRGDDDGIAAVRALRLQYPGLPALLVSGDTAPTRLREAHDAGMRLLHKPVAAHALTRAIRQEVDLAEGTDAIVR